MDAPALKLFPGDDCKIASLPVRGVGWVLRWAASLAVLAIAAVILVAFAYQLAAEQALARAAAAGLREAALPRASERSIEAAVGRRFAGSKLLDRAAHAAVSTAGNRVSIRLSVPAPAVMPRWLPVAGWFDGAEIRVSTDDPIGARLGSRLGAR